MNWRIPNTKGEYKLATINTFSILNIFRDGKPNTVNFF